MKIEPKNCEKCYVHNIFTKYILSGILLLANTSEQKDNFIDKFKLEPITTYQLGFVMKVL